MARGQFLPLVLCSGKRDKAYYAQPAPRLFLSPNIDKYRQMKLRPYQNECVEAVLRGFSKLDRLLISVPTGGGKTIIAADLIDGWTEGQKMGLGDKVLFLAHRDELIEQGKDKIETYTGKDVEREKSDSYASLDCGIVVGSVQTLQRKRLERWPKDHFKYIIVDEAHHALSKSYGSIMDHFDAKILGITATPDRGDKRNLGEVFEDVAYEVGLTDLIDQEFLSPISLRAIPLEISLTKVKTTAGDYSSADLDHAIQPYLDEIANVMAEQARDRKTLVFLPLVSTAEDFSEILNEKGLRSISVHGSDPDRKKKIADFRRGTYDVLCNAMLLTEGFDCPDVDCIVPLRPTKSRPLFCQMIGRGTRISPEKTDCLVFDFLWLHERHKLMRPAHLVAKDAKLADYMTESAFSGSKKGGDSTYDLKTLALTAKEEREKKLLQELASKAKRKAKTIDASAFGLAVHDLDVSDYQSTMKWHEFEVTEGQKEALKNAQIDPFSVMSRGHASAILSRIYDRRGKHLATPKQLTWLLKYKYQGAEQATMKQASEFLTNMWNKSKKWGK